jgi:hypothetical protein
VRSSDTHEDLKGPAPTIPQLRGEIDSTRDELRTYISELDRRRQEAFDLKLHIRKHPAVVIGVGVAIVATVAGAVALAARPRRQKAIARRGQRELSRLVSPTLPAAPSPNPLLKSLLKTALPLGVAMARRFIGRGRNLSSRPG